MGETGWHHAKWDTSIAKRQLCGLHFREMLAVLSLTETEQRVVVRGWGRCSRVDKLMFCKMKGSSDRWEETLFARVWIHLISQLHTEDGKFHAMYVLPHQNRDKELKYNKCYRAGEPLKHSGKHIFKKQDTHTHIQKYFLLHLHKIIRMGKPIEIESN